MPRGIYDRSKPQARPNAFQKLVKLAERERDMARERLARAEKDVDCIHQRRLRVARTEHDQWVKTLDGLARNLTIPAVPQTSESNGNGNGHGDVGDRLKKRGPQAGRSHKAAKLSAFDKCPGLPGRIACTNSKPRDSELCGRCQAMKSLHTVPA